MVSQPDPNMDGDGMDGDLNTNSNGFDPSHGRMRQPDYTRCWKQLEDLNDATSEEKNNGSSNRFYQCYPIESRLKKYGEWRLVAVMRAMLYIYHLEHQ